MHLPIYLQKKNSSKVGRHCLYTIKFHNGYSKPTLIVVISLCNQPLGYSRLSFFVLLLSTFRNNNIMKKKNTWLDTNNHYFFLEGIKFDQKYVLRIRYLVYYIIEGAAHKHFILHIFHTKGHIRL